MRIRFQYSRFQATLLWDSSPVRKTFIQHQNQVSSIRHITFNKQARSAILARHCGRTSNITKLQNDWIGGLEVPAQIKSRSGANQEATSARDFCSGVTLAARQGLSNHSAALVVWRQRYRFLSNRILVLIICSRTYCILVYSLCKKRDCEREWMKETFCL